MSWTEIVYGIGDLFEWSFGLVRLAGNNFNNLIIGVSCIMLIWWIGQLSKYNKKAAQEGTLK